MAHKAGIEAVVEPGGSVRDNETIDYCVANKMALVFTGTRHFKH
jgi:phosphoribosylaminoimidazolecarboxamide formyltransferase/IMP cyclohydrolase